MVGRILLKEENLDLQKGMENLAKFLRSDYYPPWTLQGALNAYVRRGAHTLPDPREFNATDDGSR